MSHFFLFLVTLNDYIFDIVSKAADVNGDKKLDQEEYFALAHPEEKPQIMQTTITKEVMQAKDKNNDGRLDFVEFTTARKGNDDEVYLNDIY